MTLHQVASSGFKASAAKGLYDRARPTYPIAALEKILTTAASNANANQNNSHGLRIAEYGAGTGIFTRLLLSHDKTNIEKIIAVEPSSGMRESFKEVTTPLAPPHKLELVEGTFHTSSIPDKWADLIVIAQAFHWNGDKHVGALSEFSRVLSPGGIVALIWNREDCMETWYKHVQPTTSVGVVARLLSKSFVAFLPEREKNEHLEKVKKIAEEGDGVKWIDEDNNVFEYPFETDLVIFKKKN